MILWRVNWTVTCIFSIIVHSGVSKRTSVERKYCLQRRSDKYLNSFLWKIERTPPIYLFGTIHVRYDFVWDYIPKNMKYAFRTSSRLVTELNFSNASTVAAIRKCRLLPGSLTLREILPNSLYVRLKMHLEYVRRKLASWLPEQWRNQLIAANIYRLLTRNWERKKVIWIVVLLMNDLTPTGVNSNQKLALDLYLGNRASKKKIRMDGLETAKDQCDPFNNLDHDRDISLAINSLIDLLKGKGFSVTHIKPEERLPAQAIARKLRKKRRGRKKSYGIEQELLKKLAIHIKNVQSLWVKMNKSRQTIETTKEDRWPKPTAPPSQVRIIQTFQKEKTYVYYYSNEGSKLSSHWLPVLISLLTGLYSLR